MHVYLLIGVLVTFLLCNCGCRCEGYRRIKVQDARGLHEVEMLWNSKRREKLSSTGNARMEDYLGKRRWLYLALNDLKAKR